MPYRVYKVGNGYKVGLVSGEKMSNGKKYLSEKPLSREGAKRQMLAVELREKGRTVNKKKSKKIRKDGFMRYDDLKTKKKKCPKGYKVCHCELKKKLLKKGETLCEKIGSK